jgi:proteasome lid subunit RPN8/RPN11
VEVAEADPDREVCGFLVRHGDGSREVVPVPNRAGTPDAPGPAGDPRQAFEVDPAAHLALSRRLRGSGGAIEAVFHSHVDGPARLSPEDLRSAVLDGRPVLPGAWQVVLGMRSGKVLEIRAFSWRDQAFEEVAAVRTGARPSARPAR